MAEPRRQPFCEKLCRGITYLRALKLLDADDDVDGDVQESSRARLRSVSQRGEHRVQLVMVPFLKLVAHGLASSCAFARGASSMKRLGRTTEECGHSGATLAPPMPM
jgi:hypothetical protein